MEEPKQPDWTISELYSRAWQIVKKNKVLWLFGIASLGFGSNFSSRFNTGFRSNSSNLQNLFQNTSKSPPQKLSQVLGTSTNPFTEQIHQITSAVPVSLYIALGVGFVLLVILGIVLNLIYSSWAEAALLKGIKEADDGNTPTIATSSRAAFPYIKSLIWLNIVPILVLLIGGGLGTLLLLSLTLALPGIAKAIPAIALTALVIGFIYALILLTFGQIWAPRLVVYEGKPAKESLFSAIRVSKKKFGAMTLLGLVNTILSAVITLAPVFLAVGFGIWAFISYQTTKSFGIGFWIPIVFIAVIFLFFFSIISGVLNSFKAAVWTIAYTKIKDQFNAQSACRVCPKISGLG